MYSNVEQCGLDSKFCGSLERERFVGRDQWEGGSMEEVGA